MPTAGRKFLMAGKGGMNITHAEPLPAFLERYGARRQQIKPLLEAFPPAALREWILGLGIETFTGSSGRVFPKEMKAAPLLRAWLHRLREQGVSFHMRHRWTGWNAAGEFCFDTPEGECTVRLAHTSPHPNGHDDIATPDNEARHARFPLSISLPQAGERGEVSLREIHINPLPPAGEGTKGKTNSVYAVVLALGGGSWPQLGSNGAWVPLLAQHGVTIAPLRPANCGFDAGWSEHFRTRFAGHPLKGVVASFTDADGILQRKQGDIMVTASGIEGGLVYALSAPVRDAIAATGTATIYLDLTPGKDVVRLHEELAHPRGSRSLSSHLQSRAGLKGVQTGLLRECIGADDFADPLRLAKAIKAVPLKLLAPRPLQEAISTAGGVAFNALDQNLMLHALPGVFCAGEMLDWEAPTGGYLLTGCFASGKVAGAGVLKWLGKLF